MLCYVYKVSADLIKIRNTLYNILTGEGGKSMCLAIKQVFEV